VPHIEISQENLDRLKSLAEPLVDTADTVLTRLLTAHNGQDNGRLELSVPTVNQATTGSRSAPRKRGRKGERARKGERTPTEAFYEPLLQALAAAGGQLPAVEAIDNVGRIMEDRLNEVDRARLPSGEVRWRNSVRWARQRLEEQGKLDGKASYGVWKITQRPWP
jgi:hypothetical protein